MRVNLLAFEGRDSVLAVAGRLSRSNGKVGRFRGFCPPAQGLACLVHAVHRVYLFDFFFFLFFPVAISCGCWGGGGGGRLLGGLGGTLAGTRTRGRARGGDVALGYHGRGRSR